MNGLERLSKLVEEAMQKGGRGGKITDAIAEHLLNNGVVVPPCRMGEDIYVVVTTQKKHAIAAHVLKSTLTRHNFWHSVDHAGTKVFLTREEANEVVAEIHFRNRASDTARVPKYYSLDDVRAMSRTQVRDNIVDIMDSMERW